ncbi:LYPLAL1 [Symbiodinium natans]|uniref:LYPLAL1 protein n=1 Tax=Symbiodinium natans TaxID=878477 RepID=A0A812PNK4_9DINO|nr:LYPLAL1 [Symbiodinium natans]
MAQRRLQGEELQLQRPSFLFTGLRAKPFWSPEDFPKVVHLLEASAPRLSEEVCQLLGDSGWSTDTEDGALSVWLLPHCLSNALDDTLQRSAPARDGHGWRWYLALNYLDEQMLGLLEEYFRAVDGGNLLDELAAHGVKTYWPDSGVRSYTLAGGRVMPIWYDRKGLPPTAPEDTASVEESVHSLVKLLDQVRADGIPANRTVIGGFSMGGGIALQLALRHPTKIAAAFVLSSFMCDNAAAYQLLENAPSTVPILMMHGEADGFIRPVWGRATARRLSDMGLKIEFISIPGVRHEISRQETTLLRDWLWNLLKLE